MMIRRYLYAFFTSCLIGSISVRANSPCYLACDELSRILTNIYSTGPRAVVPLWSKNQEEVQPQCRVEPRGSDDVAKILAVIRQHQCHFAVLGGGTSPFKGASNADRGITIDMRRMKSISFVNENPSLVSVGSGCLWADVYDALQSRNLSAVGTRNSLTGVVGSILGGGISFFSEHYGWACDMVEEFEVVLANSSVVKASQSIHPELFWALRGGGNNFGIVTRVTIEAFENPPKWYSFQLFSLDDMATVFDRLEGHTAVMPRHVWQIACTLGWHAPGQHFVISERMVASEPPELPQSIPRLNQNGLWEESPVLQTNIYERSILQMAQKMDGMNKEGFYNFFGSVTVRSSTQVSQAIARLFQEEVHTIMDAEELQVYIVYNPLTTSALRRMKSRGGNALGLSEDDGPLTVVNINLHWSKRQDEDRMRQFMRRVISGFRERAAQLEMLHPYIFQNHAFEEQDVFPGYGERNQARLRNVRRNVDPDAIFQTLQPGFFKLEPLTLDDPLLKSEL